MRGLFLILLLVPGSLSAQVILNDKQNDYSVDRLYHFCTTDTEVDIVEVQLRDFDPLVPSRVASLGFDREAHWFRFEVLNHSDISTWFLEIGFPQLDHVEVYFPDSHGNWSLQFSGDLYPISTRPVVHRNFIFPLSVRRDITTPLIIKVVSSSSVQLPLTIWSPTGLRDSLRTQEFVHGLFYGVMIIMILYNLMLYFSVRDRSTLYLVAALLAAMNIIAFIQGYTFFFLYPEHPEWNLLFAALSGPAFILSSIALARSFFNLRKYNFIIDRVLIALGFVTLATAVITIGWNDRVSYVPISILAILDFIVILVGSFVCLLAGFRPARLFVLAWVGVMVIGTLVALRNLGMAQGDWLSYEILYLGGALQALLVSLALADRINTLRLEHNMSRDLQLRLESQAKENLEKEVAIRTEEIARKHLLLSETNAVKDKLFSVVSHDLKGPLKSLKGIMEGVQLGALSKEEQQDLMKRIGDQLNLISDFLDNLLQWSRTQLQGETFVPKRERFSIKELAESCTRLLAPEFVAKNIALEVRVHSDAQVNADPNMIETVLRNLISNALKFTQPGGRVDLIISRQDDLIRIDVRDNGIGIPPDNLDRIFTLQGITTAGTREEKGTGIGLVVCKEFIERNSGRIKVTSVPGSGSMFSFTLPTR